MVRYTIVTLSLFFTIIGLALFTNQYTESGRKVASFFSTVDSTLNKASSALLEADHATVMLDNNAAFLSKLDAIKNARESIRMSYFIFSQDHSTMLLAKELIAAAKRGVDVKMIVDLHSNYKALDFFDMLEREGGQNLHVHFYNRPSKNIVTDAFYLTTPCDFPLTSDKCYKQKREAYKEFIKNASPSRHNEIILASTPYTKQFLKGLYAKDPQLIGDAIFKGQRIDPKEIMGGGGPSTLSDEDKQNLKELAILAFKSKTGNPLERITAKTKLFAAYVIYRDALAPLKATLQSLLPVSVSSDPKHGKDWEYITDFTHHKILLVDEKFLQLGGRNLENSYHMDQNALTEKYTFMDTDAALFIKKGGEQMAKAYDEFFAYPRLQATVTEMRDATSIERSDYRVLDDWKNKMDRLSDEYLSSYRAPKQSEDFVKTIKPIFTIELGGDSKVGYLENLHYFNKQMDYTGSRPVIVPPAERSKLYGSTSGREIESGKAIHAVILKALDDVCDSKEPTEVIMHNAYTLPPADFYARFGKMVRGENDCSNVRVFILTNSPETTDLGMVNSGAKFGLTQFFNYYRTHKNSRSASFNFFEYKPLSKDPTKNLSLHSKVFLIGNDVFVGSSNFDPRSLMMDTNNGLYFKNVPKFKDQYVKYFMNLLAHKEYVENKTELYSNLKIDEVIERETQSAKGLLNKYVGEKIPENLQGKVLDQVKKLFKKISDDTQKVIEEGKEDDCSKLNHLLQFI